MPIDEETLKVIKDNKPFINKIDLSSKDLNDLDIEKLAEVIKCNNSLKILNLSGNNIGPNGAKILATALENTEVVTLNLRNNSIGDEGAIALSSCSNIKELGLHDNQIGNDGAKALANSNIKKLNISGNKLNFLGIKALIDSSTITSLNCFYNQLDKKQSEAIAMRILRTNTVLTEILFSFECSNFLPQIEERCELNKAIAEERNPLKKTNLITRATYDAKVPSLLELSLFSAQHYNQNGRILNDELEKSPADLLEKLRIKL